MRLESERLILRRWRDEDLGPFAAMSADPEIMDWLGGTMTREETADYMARSEVSFEAAGMGRFAIERRADGMFLGSSGLMPGRDWLPPAPYVDIGWRLARHAWGQGYAQEAARAVARDGFERLGFPEILAITTATNVRSRAVMAAIGFVHEPHRDFHWPTFAADDPMGASVVYAARR